jgi:hypothetical protein
MESHKFLEALQKTVKQSDEIFDPGWNCSESISTFTSGSLPQKFSICQEYSAINWQQINKCIILRLAISKAKII